MTSFIDHKSPLHKKMTEWRRDFHAHPEIAYEEHRTSESVSRILKEHGLTVQNGLGGTGVVGTLEGDRGQGDAIGLRADMDALPVQELNDFDHKSKYDGKMHACGHDGHTAMLLGAACRLSENADFRGKVHFIFQPAEEGGAGALKMIEDGLFEQFPVSSIFSLHNWPAIRAGEAAVHDGAVMAAYDTFDINVRGRGGHAGIPNQGADPIVTAAQLVVSIQSVVSRNIDPLECGVISITRFSGGENYNVIPSMVSLSGTVRTFSPQVLANIKRRLQSLVEGVCGSFDCQGEIVFRQSYPATVNVADKARECVVALNTVPGVSKTHINAQPSMASEDFSFMLQQAKGCYIWLGNSDKKHNNKLHSANYEFNDEILPLGANYWISLVHHLLGS